MCQAHKSWSAMPFKDSVAFFSWSLSPGPGASTIVEGTSGKRSRGSSLLVQSFQRSIFLQGESWCTERWELSFAGPQSLAVISLHCQPGSLKVLSPSYTLCRFGLAPWGSGLAHQVCAREGARLPSSALVWHALRHGCPHRPGRGNTHAPTRGRHTVHGTGHTREHTLASRANAFSSGARMSLGSRRPQEVLTFS